MKEIFCFLVAFLVMNSGVHDFKIMGMKFYETLEHPGKKKPAYQDIRMFTPYKEGSTDTLDIGVRIQNNGNSIEKDILVRLVVTPKISLLPSNRSRLDVTDLERLRRTGTWLSPEIILEKSIDELKPHKTTELKFENIEMSYFLEEYYENSDNKYYPIELKFEATINPRDKELSLENNIYSKVLPIGLPQ